jgi:hypothetical protein
VITKRLPGSHEDSSRAAAPECAASAIDACLGDKQRGLGHRSRSREEEDPVMDSGDTRGRPRGSQCLVMLDP